MTFDTNSLTNHDVPKHVLIVAPIGAYIGRVKTGVTWALGRAYAGPKKTEARIIFIVSSQWKSEESYNTESQDLMRSFDNQELRDQFKQLIVRPEEIDIDDQESCVAWLLKTLGDFLRQGKDCVALVDLTSAPKEWLFACVYVAQFFDRIVFYYVKPKLGKAFGNFLPDVRRDEGLITEAVPISGVACLDEHLSRWTTEGTPHWKLFWRICENAAEIAQKEELPIPAVSVPFSDLVGFAKEWMPADPAVGAANMIQPEDALKSISKHLTQIKRAGLFKTTKSSVFITPRGYTLARSFFPGFDKTKAQ